jgi:hypothetical protein
MRCGLRAVAAALALWCAGPAAADVSAQSAATPSPRAHHVTVSGGLVWTGGYPIGDATAVLRGNAVGPEAPPFTLFRAESSLDASAGVDARVGFAISRGLTVELGVSHQRPGVTTALSQDAEAAAVTIDAERLSQYVIDAGVLWQLPRIRIGGRMRPFVLAGGGYLRQLYDERTVVETGSVYYAGGGVRYWLRGGDGQRRAVGLRADGRAMWRLDGVEFEDQTRVAPVLTVHAFVEF